MRRSLAFVLILPALVLPFAGCGEEEDNSTPIACLGKPGVWLTALTSAPDQVKLEDSTPISECLPPDQSPGQQATVGGTAVEVASILSAAINGQVTGESSTGDQAAIEAGYLVGALEQAAEGTQGINATLIDRVEAAATNNLGSQQQERQGAYQQGYEAGLESG